MGVSEGSIREAVQWVGATTVQTPVLTASVVEAVTTALTHNRVSPSHSMNCQVVCVFS